MKRLLDLFKQVKRKIPKNNEVFNQTYRVDINPELGIEKSTFNRGIKELAILEIEKTLALFILGGRVRWKASRAPFSFKIPKQNCFKTEEVMEDFANEYEGFLTFNLFCEYISDLYHQKCVSPNAEEGYFLTHVIINEYYYKRLDPCDFFTLDCPQFNRLTDSQRDLITGVKGFVKVGKQKEMSLTVEEEKEAFAKNNCYVRTIETPSHPIQLVILKGQQYFKHDFVCLFNENLEENPIGEVVFNSTIEPNFLNFRVSNSETEVKLNTEFIPFLYKPDKVMLIRDGFSKRKAEAFDNQNKMYLHSPLFKRS